MTNPTDPQTDVAVSRGLGGKPRGTEPAACSVLGGYFDNDYGEWCFQVISTPLWGDMTHWWPLPDLEAQIRTQDEGLVELLRERIAVLEGALEEVRQWAEAYPTAVFQEPNIEAVNQLLEANGMPEQMDRLHASWARHLLAGFARIAPQALGRVGAR